MTAFVYYVTSNTLCFLLWYFYLCLVFWGSKLPLIISGYRFGIRNDDNSNKKLT